MKRIAKHEKLELRKNITESVSIPKDVALGASMMTVTGNYDIWIENYKGILEYTADRIVIQGKQKRITITGKKISISYYNDTDCLITGYIESIQFHD